MRRTRLTSSQQKKPTSFESMIEGNEVTSLPSVHLVEEVGQPIPNCWLDKMLTPVLDKDTRFCGRRIPL